MTGGPTSVTVTWGVAIGPPASRAVAAGVTAVGAEIARLVVSAPSLEAGPSDVESWQRSDVAESKWRSSRNSTDRRATGEWDLPAAADEPRDTLVARFGRNRMHLNSILRDSRR